MEKSLHHSMVPADIHLQISALPPRSRSCSSPGCQNSHSTQELCIFETTAKICQNVQRSFIASLRSWCRWRDNELFCTGGTHPAWLLVLARPLARDGVRHLGSMSQPLPVPHTDLRTGWITFWGCLPLSAGWRRCSDDCQQPGCRASDSTHALWASSVQFTAKAVISGGVCPENIR